MSTSKHPKIRFKDENGNDYPDWEEKKLGEMFEIKKGIQISKKDLSLNGQKCILYGELFTRYDEIIENVTSKTNLDILPNSKYHDILMPSSDVTLNGLAKASCLLENDVIKQYFIFIDSLSDGQTYRLDVERCRSGERQEVGMLGIGRQGVARQVEPDLVDARLGQLDRGGEIMTQGHLEQGACFRAVDPGLDGELLRLRLLLGQHEIEASLATELGAFGTGLLGPAFAREEAARFGQVELVARLVSHAGVVLPEAGLAFQVIELVSQAHVGVSGQVEGVKVKTAQCQYGSQKTELFVGHITHSTPDG